VHYERKISTQNWGLDAGGAARAGRGGPVIEHNGPGAGSRGNRPAVSTVLPSVGMGIPAILGISVLQRLLWPVCVW
jgi:hypothetical protein